MSEADEGELPPPEFLAYLPPKLIIPGGLQPFVDAREFDFCVEKQYLPLIRIECTTQNLAYALIEPQLALPAYAPIFAPADLEELKLTEQTRQVVLCIVNLSRGQANATLNLAGPLLINLESGIGKQVIPLNAMGYSSRHRVFGDGGPAA